MQRRASITAYRQLFRNRVGACHALDNDRTVARFVLCCSKKRWADFCELPRHVRRTILRAILAEHHHNRDIYLHVTRGR